MKRLFWILYYRFKKPVGKREIVIRMCRLNGVKFKVSKPSHTKIYFTDLLGIIKIGSKWA